jgi:hypothetical protein
MGPRDLLSAEDGRRLAWTLSPDGVDRLRGIDDHALDRARGWAVVLLARLVGEGASDALRREAETARSRIEDEWLRRGPTLREAARDLWADADEGAHCPLCRKWVRRYWHRLNASMARGLAWLVLAARRSEVVDREGWVHVPTHGPRWLVRTNQHASLRLFDLAERRAADEDGRTKCSGLWRPTARGLAFVDGLVEVEDRVLTYNGEVVAHGEATLRFRDVLDVAFDYAELMGDPGALPDREQVEPFQIEEGVRA